MKIGNLKTKLKELQGKNGEQAKEIESLHSKKEELEKAV